MKLSLIASSFALVAVSLSATAARADEVEAPRSTARVHVAGAPEALEVQRWDGEWVTVCTGTCNRELDVGATYRISGSGIRTSKSFALDAKEGDDVELKLDLKSSARFTTGAALMATGAFFFTVSTVFAAGTTMIMLEPFSGDGPGPMAAVALGGLIAAGSAIVGMATFIPGVVLMAKNARSKMMNDGTLPAPPPPIFRDARATLPTPSFTPIPIWSGTF